MNASLKILIVDDMPQMCKIMFGILTDLGWQNISVAKSGQQALKLIGEQHFDIMLLDNNMPEMEGIEVLSVMKTREIAHRPKVIMVTADNKRSTIESAIQAGANDFIVKPFQPKLLEEKIARLIDK